jgi:hypothetical protein
MLISVAACLSIAMLALAVPTAVKYVTSCTPTIVKDQPHSSYVSALLRLPTLHQTSGTEGQLTPTVSEQGGGSDPNADETRSIQQLQL